jgi:hypothetical protein
LFLIPYTPQPIWQDYFSPFSSPGHIPSQSIFSRLLYQSRHL